ncbi:family 78 glycoside hydrolase catalytic domain [Sunxiuqinia sp. A32]|uniref:family 78 glycoside hydrolase catalytic domain n=1 Tax=Sunxiuqinia sp. A32 TaxID=3461496 RepID=UPI004045E4AE
MKILKRLNILLGIVLIITLNGAFAFALEVKNLRTEYLKNPIGIDVVQPRFSWEIEASERGTTQSAYEITVSRSKDGSNPIWNSGKIESDRSVNNKYEGEALAPSTRYYWHVTIWDNTNRTCTSTETALFETGLFGSGWGDAKWIKSTTLKQGGLNDQLDRTSIVDYSISMDFEINQIVAGPCFSVTGSGDFFMWQFNLATDGKSDNTVYFRPHQWRNGGVSVIKEVEISDKVKIEKNVIYHLRIDITGKIATTYIDDIKIDATENPTGESFVCANLGFRQARSGAGIDEQAYFDNVKVTTLIEGSETNLFEEDFSNSDFSFSGGQLIDGRLFVTSSDNIVFQGTSGIPMFRKEFSFGKEIESAKIYSSALGVYDLFINGNRVGTALDDNMVIYDELKPGWTDYFKTAQYTTYDVTHLLQPGENAIGAQVASGWWKGGVSHGEYGNPDLSFIAKLVIQYADGSTENVVTDNSWLTTNTGPIRMADIYNGETYDARNEMDCYSAGYDDAEWFQTMIYNGFQGELRAFAGTPVQVRSELELDPVITTVYNGRKANGTTHGEINKISEIEGVGIIQLKKGETAIFDLGQNMVGWVKFNLKGERGTQMKLRFGEMLNDSGSISRGNDGPKGSIYTANLRSAKATLNYILKGSVEGESYHPSLTFMGFRYCEITATQNIEILSLVGEVVGSVNEEGSSFSTSNPDVNKLYSNVIWGQRSNFLSIPTDCPQRDERLGWTGDTQIFSRAAAYNADVAAFFHKWMRDMRDSQREDGAYPDVAPHAWVGYGQGAWAEAAIIVPWNIYLMYDDLEIIKENYESMEKYFGFLAAQSGNGYQYNGAGTNYGDWVSYEPTDSRYISVCYYAYAAQLMSKMSKALSFDDGDFYSSKAEEYNSLYENIKTEFQRRYIEQSGVLKEVSQTAYLLALKLDLFPTDKAKKDGLDYLETRIANNGNKLSTGFVGTGILNQTLSEFGANNTAYNLLLQRNNPSWLYSVDQGATTIWERWDSYTIEKGFQDVGMNSFNHYAYGAVSEWMFRFVAGIEPDESNPGFKQIILQPVLDTRKELPQGQDRITSVSAKFHSYYGDILSEWKITEDNSLTYITTVPANTKATLYLPQSSDGIVYEGSVLAENTEGVTFVKKENGKLVYNLESGTYTFKMNVLTVNVNEKKELRENFKIYPNPVHSALHIANEPTNYMISSMIGAFVDSGTSEIVNVEYLPDGLYFIRVGDKDHKFIKL